MRLLRLDADMQSGRGACLRCPVRPRRPILLPCHAPTKSANIERPESRVQYLTTSCSQAKQVAEAYRSGTRTCVALKPVIGRHKTFNVVAQASHGRRRVQGRPTLKSSNQVPTPRLLPTLKPSPSAFSPQARRRRATSAVDGMHNCPQAVSQHGAAMGKSATSITSFVSARAAMTTCRKLQKPPFCRGPPLASQSRLSRYDGLDGSDLPTSHPDDRGSAL